MYQHKSGAEKRRGKKRAQEALQNVLSKTPKLDQFFGKKSTDETVSKTPASSQSHCVPDLWGARNEFLPGGPARG